MTCPTCSGRRRRRGGGIWGRRCKEDAWRNMASCIGHRAAGSGLPLMRQVVTAFQFGFDGQVEVVRLLWTTQKEKSKSVVICLCMSCSNQRLDHRRIRHQPCTSMFSLQNLLPFVRFKPVCERPTTDHHPCVHCRTHHATPLPAKRSIIISSCRRLRPAAARARLLNTSAGKHVGSATDIRVFRKFNEPGVQARAAEAALGRLKTSNRRHSARRRRGAE